MKHFLALRPLVVYVPPLTPQPTLASSPYPGLELSVAGKKNATDLPFRSHHPGQQAPLQSHHTKAQHFSGSPVAELALNGYRFLGQNRPLEMFLEDFVGFGVLRTAIDMLRGLFFGNDHLNWALGRERITREGCSILTDNVSAGVFATGVAFGVGALIDRQVGQLMKSNVGFDSLHLMKASLSNIHVPESLTEHSTQSLKALLEEQCGQQLKPRTLTAERLAAALNKTNGQSMGKLAQQVAYELNLNTFGLKLPHGLKDGSTELIEHSLPELLEDWALMHQGLAGKSLTAARGLVETTLKWKSARLAVLLGSFALTLSVPKVNHWLTKKLHGLDSYPGELGLNTQQAQPPGFNGTGFDAEGLAQAESVKAPTWWEKAFPYVGEKLKQGNPLPLLGSMLPLVFATGLFDTYAKHFVVPAIAGLKEGALQLGRFTLVQAKRPAVFGRHFNRLLQFEKKAPWTSQQQIAMLFAGLIGARLVSARSGTEYRERAVESTLGWSTWILGSPIIKGLLAKGSGEAFALLRPGTKQLRSVAELEAFAGKELTAKGKTLDQAKTALDTIGLKALLINVGLMGIAEPVLAMFTTWWTHHRATNQEQPLFNSAELDSLRKTVAS